MLKNKKTAALAAALLIFSGSIILLVEKKDSLYHESTGTVSSVQNNDDHITNSRRNIITETVKKVSSSIVGINVTEVVQYQDPFSSMFNDPFFRQFFGDRSTNQKVKSLGSGFIISDDGYIVTNDHVAGNASEITVTMTNGEQVPAKLIGSDRASDICLLKINKSNLPYVSFGNSR